MIGILLEFTESSPFSENTVFIRTTTWQEFEEKLCSQFNSECSYLQIDCLDRANHSHDAEFTIWDSYMISYPCNQTVIKQEIK